MTDLTRPIGAACLALLLLANPAAAQQFPVDPELEALIPDSAVANPEGWAKGAESPADDSAITPTSPLAAMPELTLPWPDEAIELPELAELDPETDLASLPTDPDAQAPTATGDVAAINPRLSLVFPADPAAFPDRQGFLDRFRMLSSLVTLGGKEDNVSQIAVRARSDRELLVRLLRICGYYDGEVMQAIGGIAPGQDQAAGPITVRFEVFPGHRYQVGAVALGDLDSTGQDFPMLRGSFAIWPKDPVNSDNITRAVTDLGTALANNGYAFARTGEPDLLVDHAREQGDLSLPVHVDGKYVIGPITSDLEHYMSADHLAEIARFRTGDVYKRSEIDDLRRAVLATGLVASVNVTPRKLSPPADGKPGVVALDVSMAKAPQRTISGAIGYDTGDGFRLEAAWEHRNLFPPEGMLRLRGIVGTKEQLAGVTFRRNNFRGRDQVLTLDLYANNVTRTAYEARTVAFSGTFEKLTTLIFQKPWVWSVGIEVLATNEREGAVGGVNSARQSYYIAALPVRAAFDSSDDLLDPARGFRAALRLSPELSTESGQHSSYVRVQGDLSAYLLLGKGVVLAARTRIGSIPGAPITEIAPSRRFYAGGGGSVRGYGYQLIGPRDMLGQPSGGRSLSEFSFEARVKTGLMGGAVSVVPFVDAGSVDDSPAPRLRNMRYGAGLGLRYQTGFGPIRIDIGTPLKRRPGESRIGVYVALGQAF